MIEARALLGALADRGVSGITGVPCSYLTPLINRVASDPGVRYLRSTHEGEAVAVAVGAWLAGSSVGVIAQNSGLGNMVNPLSSLVFPCRIPFPVMLTWRGEPGGDDEPQHELMGARMCDLLSLLHLSHTLIEARPECLGGTLDVAWSAMKRERLPHVLLVRGNTFVSEPLDEPADDPPERAVEVEVDGGVRTPPTRIDALSRLLDVVPEAAAIVSTTGKASRELFTLADRPQHFYLVGAMGSASGVGLGVALHSDRPVLVIDGDGAALMRLGAMAAVGAHRPERLVHLVLDNGSHDSTGGQRSLSANVDLASVASACGYRRIYRVDGLDGLVAAFGDALANTGPSFIRLAIRRGSLKNLGRPTIHPSDVARRFRDYVTGGDA